jgi:hypothetical protein
MVKVAADWRLILLSTNVAALCRACSDSSRNRIFHVYKNTPCFEFLFRSRYLLTCDRPNQSMRFLIKEKVYSSDSPSVR